MKLPPGKVRVDVTTGGTSSVLALVTNGGDNLMMGTVRYHWSAADGLYVADKVPATFDPSANGTHTGVTGVPGQNPDTYGGTWHVEP